MKTNGQQIDPSRIRKEFFYLQLSMFYHVWTAHHSDSVQQQVKIDLHFIQSFSFPFSSINIRLVFFDVASKHTCIKRSISIWNMEHETWTTISFFSYRNRKPWDKYSHTKIYWNANNFRNVYDKNIYQIGTVYLFVPATWTVWFILSVFNGRRVLFYILFGLCILLAYILCKFEMVIKFHILCG